MKTMRPFIYASAVALLVALCALPSFAGDPPSRVARLNYMSGEVSMQPGGVDDWAPATINRPITTADRLWTDKEARAELHIGSAAIRMGSETSVTLTNLSDNVVQFELYQGTLNVQVARLSHDEIFEIDTPNTAFTLVKPGNYRFDVDSNGDATLITVWKGKGIATGEGSDVQVEARRQVRFTTGRTLAHQTFTAPGFDAFDNWCLGLDERRERAVSARYVSPDVIGYEDLDEYGRWRELPLYGAVWFPARVSIGWEPYRYGHWAWIEPWGWTWVDDAPWGFAPFHYGRWVVVGGSWGWVPGPIHVRPYYAPALVVWTGSGTSIGWFPLGYGEPFIPSYRVSRDYFRVVNVNNTRITNITYVTNNYYHVDNVRITNIHYVHENRVTIVDQKVIVDSRRIDRDVYIDRDHDNGWHNGRDRWVASCPPVPPSRHSVLGERADNDARRPPDRILYRPVVMKRVPPERPVPFDDKRAEIERHGGRPLDSSEENHLRQKPVEVAERDKDRGFRPDRDHDRQLSDDHKDRDDHNDRPSNGRNDRPSDDRKDRSGDDRRDHGNDDRNDHSADASRNSNGHDFPSRVPRPPRREDGNGQQGGQADRGNGDPHQPGQNQGGNDNRRGNGPQGNNGQGNDRGDLARQRQGWAGEHANGDSHTPDQSANNGHGSNGNNGQGNGNKPQGNGQDAGDLARARQPWAGERANRDPHTPDQNAAGDNRSNMRQVPRPPQSNSGSNDDRKMPVQQADRSFPHPSDAQRNNNRPPMQQSSSMGGVESRGDNQRHAPAEDRSAPRPSYGDRGAGPAPVQQAERSAPRMSPPSESRPAMQPQRSSAPQSHPSGGGNSGGSRGNESHGNAGHDHGDSHGNDSKPKN